MLKRRVVSMIDEGKITTERVYEMAEECELPKEYVDVLLSNNYDKLLIKVGNLKLSS